MLDKDEEGSKKVQLRHVPPILVLLAAGPLTQGASRYGSFNWRYKNISLSGHLEAIERHLAAFKDGEDCAPDSGFSHLAHAAATLGVIMDAEECGTLVDDRHKGPAGEILANSPFNQGPAAPEAVLPLGGDWFKPQEEANV